MQEQGMRSKQAVLGVAVLVIAAMTCLCYVGIHQSARFNAVVVAIKVAVIVLFLSRIFAVAWTSGASRLWIALGVLLVLNPYVANMAFYLQNDVLFCFAMIAILVETLLASRLPGLLPEASEAEALETAAVHSVSGRGVDLAHWRRRPFRAPHHLASAVAIAGGGSNPRPGEISLAHHGVLFLDELPEFKRSVLEVMRQPMEERRVTISRAKVSIDYPANFMLVASMNPSPGGYFNDPDAPVASSPAEMQRYLSKISGPLLDRIDIHIEVTPVTFEKLSDKQKAESSKSIRERVTQAREIQAQRFEHTEKVNYNAQMNVQQIREYCDLDAESSQLLKTAMERLNLSARAYDRILKVSRTIADLDKAENIQVEHISEAIQYRSLDRENWAG